MNQEQPNYDDREFLISRYIDGDLDQSARREFEAALSDDPKLARMLEAYRRTDRFIRSAGHSGPELDWERFAQETRARCARVGARKRRPLIHRLYTPLAAAATIALACTAYLMVSRESTGPATAPRVVLVQLTRPAGTIGALRVGRVVMVRPRRTPPSGFVDARPSETRYAVAAAGADPFESPSDVEETSPYF